MKFTLHTLETAPSESKPLLDDSLKSFGMIPGLHAVMADSAPVLSAYKQLHELFQQTSFDAEEMTVIWQTVNVEHECNYCVPAHTGIAHMMKIDPAITEALREQKELPTEKLQALHLTTLALVRNRGHLSQEERARFYAAGYENLHLQEIVLGIAQKVMSNYINHFAETPTDAMFKEFTWSK